MHDEKLHINPDPEKEYPVPEIPADEAWNKMAGLLDTEMPVTPSEPGITPKPSPSGHGGGFLGGSINFWIITLGVLGVTSLLTWGILRLTNKPVTSENIHDTTSIVQNSILSDTLTSTYQNHSYAPDKYKPAETVEHLAKKQNLPESQPARGNNVQLKAEPQTENKINFEQDPGIPSSSVTDKTGDTSTAFIPSRSGADTMATPAENVHGQQNADEIVSQDVINGPDSTDLQPEFLSPVADSAKSPIRSVPGGNNPDITWQTGVFGNIGQVFQKGRDANLFYGGMLTGGLWNKKWKAGIETGVGWEGCNDYGSVLNTIRIQDSITVDSGVQIKYTDTTRITWYKYRYQFLQVPLFISKQVLTRGNFSLDVKTGPVIGIMISEQKTLDYTSGPEYGEIMGTIDSDYSRLKLSWQWQVMPQLRWNINDRLSFNLSPSVNFYLNNLYDGKNRPANIPYGISIYGGLIFRIK